MDATTTNLQSINIADAAVAAYDGGNHIHLTPEGPTVRAGQDETQYAKAIRIKQLERVARAICLKHNTNPE